jgi:hypothetical protein
VEFDWGRQGAAFVAEIARIAATSASMPSAG